NADDVIDQHLQAGTYLLKVASTGGADDLDVTITLTPGSELPQFHTVAGILPYLLVASDFNGDGRTHLSTANYGSHDVSILLGQGDGNFRTHQVSYPVGSNPIAIAAGDFNGDGRLDLAVANVDSNDVSILLGNGDGTIVTGGTYLVGAYPQSIVAGDFNGDG